LAGVPTVTIDLDVGCYPLMTFDAGGRLILSDARRESARQRTSLNGPGPLPLTLPCKWGWERRTRSLPCKPGGHGRRAPDPDDHVTEDIEEFREKLMRKIEALATEDAAAGDGSPP